MLLVSALILIIFTIFLARKDGTSFLLKEKHEESWLTFKRLKRWHLDGVIIYLIFTSVLARAIPGHNVHVFVQALLVRLALYDVVFNNSAQLDWRYLGSTAAVDKEFIKIFGESGAIKKSIAFLVILVLTFFLKI